ncbi:hypothetical protein PISMIDRAFT_572206 [Pisolithus microcarpus 441]|uniref:Uncharacterized protein n=1 Tax=Pisolithus microcarpus 441 TaxID=765257 RepID=A0A0C9ZEP9_9AGAM|nr:hypothetical protein PISMIDRAFT_572206 [Pisolithus microcarpus 441]
MTNEATCRLVGEARGSLTVFLEHVARIGDEEKLTGSRTALPEQVPLNPHNSFLIHRFSPDDAACSSGSTLRGCS